MKIIIVGGTGTIGKAVVNALSAKQHTIITVGHTQGDLQVDIADFQSIEKMYQKIGAFDALISTTGKVPFGSLAELNLQNYKVGVENKLLGQISLVLIGLKYINSCGSFTLTSGILSHDPVRKGTIASVTNGGIDAFVKSAAIELPKNIRINAVSPTLLAESAEKYGSVFSGFEPVAAKRVALAYVKSVEGAQTGQVYPVWK